MPRTNPILYGNIMNPKDIRQRIISLVGQYAENDLSPKEFKPGKDTIHPSGKVLSAKEIQFMVEASLDGFLTVGRFNSRFERKLADFVGVSHAMTVNSGSSANLVAFNTLTSPKLQERAIKPGDEVITVATGFPTTVNPIVQFGAIPVFVDINFQTLNIEASLVEEAITPKTKAIVLAHTLGNPFELEEITTLCKKYDLWLIEDCCDALGSTYNGKNVGTFGDLATLSFYPAHHITMGEGGAVLTQNPLLNKIAESFRDWGRDCYCPPARDNTCGKRFEQKFDTLPEGYDHKYVYTHLGYNLKITDMQAACGLAQIERIDEFVNKRRKNFQQLKKELEGMEDFLKIAQETPCSVPSWFGFPVTLKESPHFNRTRLNQHLNKNKIGTRLIFAGNIVCQPYFQNIRYKISKNLKNTDKAMNNSFWLGVWPGLDERHFSFIGEKLKEFFIK